MSENEECETIEFNWKIENFSYRKDELLSPSFGLVSPDWILVIYNTSNHISLSVRKVKKSPVNKFCCSIAFLDSDGKPTIFKETNPDTKCTYEDLIWSFISTDMLDWNKSKYLPDDTLTIQCRLWQPPTGITTPVPLFARTRIERTRIKTFNWDVAGVSSHQSIKRCETITDGESVTIELILNDDDVFKVTTTTSIVKIHAKIEITVLDASGMEIELANCENQFQRSNQEWNFFTNVTKTRILSYQNQYFPSDTLSLQFTCTFSGYAVFNRLVDESEIHADIPRITEALIYADEPESNQLTKSQPSNTITQTLQEVLDEGFLSDFNLRICGKMFPVHKVILGARSKVFRAMFTTEMKEKEGSCVDVPDVDEDTLQRLLLFAYTDRLDEDMGWETASSLYAAADKYALDPLKQRCSAILKSGLCVSSVLEVLSLADMHHDQDLKASALDFISLNDQNVIGTELWKEFEKENSKLALDTFRNLYMKKKRKWLVFLKELFK